MSRRSFVNYGLLGISTIGFLERAKTRSRASEDGESTSKTSLIFLELAGGPSQFETYDPKPLAPKEYRGPLDTIATNIPGFFFSEYMTEQAKIADQMTIIRSIRHGNSSHDPSSHLTQTGYYKPSDKNAPNSMPCVGAIAAKYRGPNRPMLPAYVAIPQIMRNGGAAQLGPAFAPFVTQSDPNRPDFQVRNLSVARGITETRLSARRELLSQVDGQKRLFDPNGSSAAIDEFTEKAFDLVTGPQARDAFNISLEDPKTRDIYGRSTVGQSLLLARRLVEAGVTCVTVRVPGWDDHAKIAVGLKSRGPAFDQGFAALIKDIKQRGLDKQVLVVAMGEFGRTPRINPMAGRDHWGSVMSIALAGGGLKPGIFGETNSKGEVPTSLPYRPENVLATIYRHLGIEPNQSFEDFSGRPRYILEERNVIREII